MRDVIFALLGMASGYKALQRARIFIEKYRLLGETFGEGHFTSHALSMPIVVVVNALLYVAMSRVFTHDFTALTFGVLVGAGMWLVLIDLDTHLLPRHIVYRTMALAVPLLLIASLVDDSGSALSMVGGGLTMWIVLQVCEVLSRGGIGKGDVPFAGLLGLYVGWMSYTNVLIALVSSFVAGGMVAFVLLITRKANLNTRFAFGPFLFLGALIAVLR